MLYHFKIHKEKNGYWAECIELEGCQTQGNTPEELRKNIRVVLDLYLDEPAGSNFTFPLPDSKARGKNILEVPVDPRVAFAVLLKHYRKANKISQALMAEKLNMKNVYSYQRLEKRTDPKLSTITNRRRDLLSAQLVGGQADDEGDDQRDDAEHHAHHDVEFAVFLIEHVLNSPVDARPEGSGDVGGILTE